MPFDNLLQLAAEAERQPLTEFARQHPEMKTFFDLGEQVHALNPRMKTLGYESQPDGVVTELEKWRGWLVDGEKGWKFHEADKARIQEALAESMATVAELQATQGTDMTADEIKEVVKATLKEYGAVTSPDLETKLAELVEKKVSPLIESRVNGTSAVWEDVYKRLTPRMSEHERKYGEPIDVEKILEAMRAHQKETGQYLKPDAAYSQVYAEKIAAKAQAQIDADKAAARAEGIAEGRKAAAASSGRANPVDGRGSSTPAGALMTRHAAKMEKLKKEGGEPKLGDGSLASRGAQEFREREAAAGA